MLNHPTLDKLLALKLTGMAKALSEQMDHRRARRSVSKNAWACSSIAR